MSNTTTNKATALQTQILCINTMYQHCKMIIDYEVGALKQHIGKAIFKQDGSFKMKYDHARLTIEKQKVNVYGFDFWIDTHYYHNVRYGCYEITVITTVTGGGYDRNGVNCNHSQQRQSFDLFKLDKDGILTGQDEKDISFIDKVYNEADILAAAENVKEAAKQYESAISAVPHYFRDTLYLNRLR